VVLLSNSDPEFVNLLSISCCVFSQNPDRL
jgi:hypothetical protein